jgi:flagellar hook-basal body complex protein FliE
MSQMQIDQVLAQIRSLSASGGISQRPAVSNQPVSGPGFGTLLKQGIDAVNAQQQDSTRIATAYERGQPGVDLATVMLESQKASVSFRALTEVRNRLVSAYQDIMNMPV